MANRSQRRREVRAAAKVGEDVITPYVLRLALSQPGSPMRSEYPSLMSKTVGGENEADVVRAAIITLIQDFGFIAEQRAVVGVLAEALNPMGAQLRGMLAWALMQGCGLRIEKGPYTTCVTFGVEKTEVDPEPEHKEVCDTETGDVLEHAGWVTEDVIRVDNPIKYPALQTESPVEPDGEPEPEPEPAEEAAD